MTTDRQTCGNDWACGTATERAVSNVLSGWLPRIRSIVYSPAYDIIVGVSHIGCGWRMERWFAVVIAVGYRSSMGIETVLSLLARVERRGIKGQTRWCLYDADYEVG